MRRWEINTEDILNILPCDAIISFAVENYTEELLNEISFEKIKQYYLKYK